jgi:DNA-binding FadR family transcriptional regulator
MSSRLHMRVLDGLGGDITAGRVAPGTVLRIADIARLYAVSIPVAREAARVLQSVGLIALTKKVGLTVLGEEQWNALEPLVIRWRLESPDREAFLRSLIELRRAVEPSAAALAAERGSAPDRARVLEAARAMQECAARGDLEGYLAADVAFHVLLVSVGGNAGFRALRPAVAEALRGRSGLGVTDHEVRARELDLHVAIGTAVEGGDAARAEQASRELLTDVETRVRRGAPQH